MAASRIALLLVAVAAALASSPGHACSVPSQARVFVPDKEAFERKHPHYQYSDVAAPTVRILGFKRATAPLQGNCGAHAWLDLEVAMPAGSRYTMDEVGLVFRSEPGRPQDLFMAFPNFPIVARNRSKDGAAIFRFALVDAWSDREKPFGLDLEVLAINHGLQVGPSTKIAVRSA